MLRHLYMAGVDAKKRAAAAAACECWLLSVSLLPKKGLPTWLEPYMGKRILWDPGTFSYDSRTLRFYRDWLHKYARPHHEYLSYDEIGGDPDLNMAYLHDMRRRGFFPIPVYHPGMPVTLFQEPRVALGGLVPLTDAARQRYLDGIFYGPDPAPAGRVHLLGMANAKWFARYPASTGDSTTWLPRFPHSRAKSIDEWVQLYGEQDIPLTPSLIQGRMAI